MHLRVVSDESPFARSTWSGTPLSLVSAAKDAGVEVSGWHPDPPGLAKDLFFAGMARAVWGSVGLRFRRYLLGAPRHDRRELAKVRAGEPAVPYLHTDRIWLPYSGASQATDHLFRDTSLRQLADGVGAARRLQAELRRSHERLTDVVGHVFTTSEWAREGFLAEGFDPDRVHVVGTGIGFPPPERLPGLDKYTSGRTLTVAKVRFQDKGLDLLLEGFSRARERLPHLTLQVVAPDGIVEPRPGVEVLSDLSFARLIELYEGAALFALPARYEPWGLVYLEALSCGTPVLGSGRCAFPEISGYGAYGTVVEDLTAEAVADALVRAHADPARLEAQGSLGREHVSRNVSWEATMSRILGVLFQEDRRWPAQP